MDANPAISNQPNIGRRHIIVGTVAAILTGLFATFVWFVIKEIRRAGEAERNLLATIFAIGLVEKFVEEHRHWPKSWDELEQWKVDGVRVEPQKERTNVIRIGGTIHFEWPSSSQEIRKRVVIDFNAKMKDMSEQRRGEFQAIQPNGECYDYRIYGFIESLQDAIRKAIDTKAEKFK
jgi:hypothetical protein